MGNNHNKVYDQVAVPSAGGSNHPGKDSEDYCEALGKPERFNRTVPPVATKERTPKEARDKQLGSNIELAWTRKK